MVSAPFCFPAALQRDSAGLQDLGWQGTVLEKENHFRVSFSVTHHPHAQLPDRQGLIYLWMMQLPHCAPTPVPCLSPPAFSAQHQLSESWPWEEARTPFSNQRLLWLLRVGFRGILHPGHLSWVSDKSLLSIDLSSGDGSFHSQALPPCTGMKCPKHALKRKML